MPVYELRSNADGTELSFSPVTSIDACPILLNDVDGNPMTVVASFWERNWRSALKSYHAIMGWESR